MADNGQDLVAALDAPQETAEAWVPQEGDKLVGSVTRLDKFDGGYGEYPILTVSTETGTTQNGSPVKEGTEFAFHAFNTVPKNEVEKQNAQPGDRLGVAFLGEGRSKNGQTFKNYRVVVQKGQGATPSASEDQIVKDAEALGATESDSDGIQW